LAVYAVGDIQGCTDELKALLDRLRFDPGCDRLWLTGDLVARGPDSAGSLRFVKSLGPAAVTVLGNHDLHLLATARGHGPGKPEATLKQVLKAGDGEELLHWLRHRPMLHAEDALGWTMVHAGLPPQWDLAAATGCARELEAIVRGPDLREYAHAMYGNKPDRWRDDLSGMDRLRFATNCFTRLRYCEPDGTLNLKPKGPPGSQPRSLLPWFKVPGRRSAGERILFGHWSTLGYYAGDNVWGLDTGCLWGGTLTALRIDVEPAQPFHLPCPQLKRP
jgi:bis(5'-nucleosyl)-tetraphosphatase (symmetrical)